MKRRLLIGMMLISVVFGMLIPSILLYIFEDVQIHDLTSSLDAKITQISRDLTSGALTYIGLQKLAQYSDYTVATFTKSGAMTFNSDGTTGYLEKSAERVEVTQALEGGYGFVRRNSSTLQRPMLYIAEIMPDDTVIRLGYPLDTMIATRQRFIWYSISIGLTALILYFLFAYWLSRRLTNEQNEVVVAMGSLIAGRYGVEVIERNSPGPISVTFNKLSHHLDDQYQKLSKDSETLHILLDTMQSGVIIVDSHMHISAINQQARTYLNIRGETDGRELLNVAPNADAIEQALKEGMKQATMYTAEIAAQDKGGRTQRPLKLYVSTMREKNKVLGALAFIDDIAELRRLERARTDFAANVSHELRTPLTSIQGFIETLQLGEVRDPEKVQQIYNIMLVEARRLNSLIGDILSLSKYESGGVEQPRDPVRLDIALHEVVDFLSGNAESQQIELILSSNLPEIIIYGAKDRLKQLLINIIENGIKYNMPGGKVMISVYKLNDTAYISISDTGIGIAKENQSRIFERFYRVDKGRSRAKGGTGLGLAIVKHILQSMRGTIEIHSVPNQGSEFLIALPTTPPENMPEESDDAFPV